MAPPIDRARAYPAPEEAPGAPRALPAEVDLELLEAARCPVPALVPVAWVAGKFGSVVGRGRFSLPVLADELRARLGRPFAKGEGEALLGGLVDPGRERRDRTAMLATSLLVVDCDGSGVTLEAALARVRALELEGLWFPSPSEPCHTPAGALRWRGLVPVAEGTPPEVHVAAGPLLGRLFESILGGALDCSPLRGPEHLAFQHPREEVGPRPPEALVHTLGRALDLAALLEKAALLGLWSRREWDAARKWAVPNPAGLAALLEREGIILGPPDARGWCRALCLREAWHGGGRTVRLDSSCSFNVFTGAWVCHHQHSAGPEREQGSAGTRKLLRWLGEDRPALGGIIAEVLDRGGLGVLREALEEPPPGEAPRRSVDAAGLLEDLVENARQAQRDGYALAYTPTTGGGKSYAIGPALGAMRDAGMLPTPREGANHPGAVAAVVVPTREDIPRAAESVLRTGLGVLVYTPPHLVFDANGKHACRFPDEARAVYGLGGSTRATCCDPVCSEGCLAYGAWVPWWMAPSGGARAEAWHRLPRGALWVAVVTAASAARVPLLRGAHVVLDEGGVLLDWQTGKLGPEELEAAERWAPGIAPTLVERTLCDGPRVVARELARAARLFGAAGLASLSPEERLAWGEWVLRNACAPGAARDSVPPQLGTPWSALPAPALLSPGDRAEVARWCGCEILAPELPALAARAWAQNPRHYALRREAVPNLPRGGNAALAGLARWLGGCTAVLVKGEGGAAVSLSWRAPAAELSVAALEGGGGVTALDATLNHAMAGAALAPHRVVHVPVRVPGGAEVRRVQVSSRRCGRQALVPGGGVQWDAALPALRALHGALLESWREGYGCGPGVVFVARPLALVLEALTHPDPTPALAAAVERTSLSGRGRERVLGALTTLLEAPEKAAEAAALVRALGPVSWCYFGSKDARGSNDYRDRAWCAVLGDARPSGDATSTRLRAMLGREPTELEVRAALDRAASEAHEQAFGRLRAVRRMGERLAMIGVGAVPALGMYGAAEGEAPVVLHTLASATAAGRDPAVPATLAVNEVRDLELSVGLARDVDPTAHPLVLALAEAGWTQGDLAAGARVTAAAARGWWRGESMPRAKALRRLEALLEGRSAPSVRLLLRRMRSGRGWSRVWRGVGLGGARVAGLGRLLEQAGARVAGRVLEKWLDLGGDLAAPVLGALLEVLPGLCRVFPPLGEVPHPLRVAWGWEREPAAGLRNPSVTTPPPAETEWKPTLYSGGAEGGIVSSENAIPAAVSARSEALEALEERAAIMEHDGGLPRARAEALAGLRPKPSRPPPPAPEKAAPGGAAA